MATPSFNLNYTIISTCDADDWDGGAGTLDPDIKKQGTNSLSIAVRNDGEEGITGTWDMSGTDAHIRMWIQYTFPGTLQTKANGGIQLWVDDGTNTNYYYVGGVDTHNGAWELMQADLSAPDVDGGVTLSAVTSAGWKVDNLTAARNVINFYWDYFVYGTGYEIYGGTTGDKITWSTLAATDLANGYGLVTYYNGVYFLNAKLTIGDTVSTNDCYFNGDGEVIVFYSAGESTTLYEIIGDGNATGTTDITMNSTVIKSASSRFVYDMNNTNLDSYAMDGSKLDYAGLSYFKTGQTISNNLFNNCSQVEPSTSTFSNNIFADSIATDGAMLFPTDSTGVSNLTFINCDNGVEYDATSDTSSPTFDNFKFDDEAGNFDVNNTSGGAITISIVNTPTGAANSYTGSVVTFANNVTVTFTGMKDNTEVRVMQAGSETVELAGIEDAIVGTTDDRSFSFTLSGGTSVDYRIGNKFYEILEVYAYTIPGTVTSIPIQQRFDRNYYNP